MDMLSYLFHALGGVLIWVASVLALEELMFGGLALLLHLVASRPATGSKKGAAGPQFSSKGPAVKVQQ
jgi:hypothetical protein